MATGEVISERKRLIPIIIAVSLVGVAIGLFLGDNLPLLVLMLAVIATWVLFAANLREYVAAAINWKKLVIRAVAVGLIGVVTGLFLGGDLLPSAPAADTSVQPPEYEVWIVNRVFVPATITVPAGTTVTWRNKEMEEHTVTSNDDLFDGVTFPFSYAFTDPGTYSYFCRPHPDFEPHDEVVGVVIVE